MWHHLTNGMLEDKFYYFDQIQILKYSKKQLLLKRQVFLQKMNKPNWILFDHFLNKEAFFTSHANIWSTAGVV
jgi:hypothetical protein